MADLFDLLAERGRRVLVVGVSDESESFWGFLMSSPRSRLCGNQVSGTQQRARRRRNCSTAWR